MAQSASPVEFSNEGIKVRLRAYLYPLSNVAEPQRTTTRQRLLAGLLGEDDD